MHAQIDAAHCNLPVRVMFCDGPVPTFSDSRHSAARAHVPGSPLFIYPPLNACSTPPLKFKGDPHGSNPMVKTVKALVTVMQREALSLAAQLGFGSHDELCCSAASPREG